MHLSLAATSKAPSSKKRRPNKDKANLAFASASNSFMLVRGKGENEFVIRMANSLSPDRRGVSSAQLVPRTSHAATALMVAHDAEFGDEGKSDEEKDKRRGRGQAAAARRSTTVEGTWPSQRLASAAHMRVGDIVLDSDERLCKVTDIRSDKVSEAWHSF